jgi:hypothetical protein
MTMRHRLHLLRRWAWRALVRLRHRRVGQTPCVNCLTPVRGRLTDLNFWRGTVVCEPCHHVLFSESVLKQLYPGSFGTMGIDIRIRIENNEGEDWKR